MGLISRRSKSARRTANLWCIPKTKRLLLWYNVWKFLVNTEIEMVTFMISCLKIFILMQFAGDFFNWRLQVYTTNDARVIGPVFRQLREAQGSYRPTCAEPSVAIPALGLWPPCLSVAVCPGVYLWIDSSFKVSCKTFQYYVEFHFVLTLSSKSFFDLYFLYKNSPSILWYASLKNVKVGTFFFRFSETIAFHWIIT